MSPKVTLQEEEIKIASVEELGFEGEPERLDVFLTAYFPELSRTRVQDLIQRKLVLVNGAPVKKSGVKLEEGDNIRVSLPEIKKTDLIAEEMQLDVLYEDENVIVINKQPGLVVHPAAGHASGTLINAVLAHAPDIEGVGGEDRPGLVHRLDKDTSGIILLAKNDFSHQWLQDQFSERSVKKFYITLVEGRPPTTEGLVETFIGRDPRQRKRMAVVRKDKGRKAISEYRTLQEYSQHTLLEVQIHTGRTHQIRVHMAFMKCPVVGDPVYGRRKKSLPLDRQFLHAARLIIQLPGEEEETVFEAPLPEDLQAVLADLE